MPISIRDRETDRLARKVVRLAGETITDARDDTLRERLARERARREGVRRGRLLAIGERCASHIGRDGSPADHADALYGDVDLPRSSSIVGPLSRSFSRKPTARNSHRRDQTARTLAAVQGEAKGVTWSIQKTAAARTNVVTVGLIPRQMSIRNAAGSRPRLEVSMYLAFDSQRPWQGRCCASQHSSDSSTRTSAAPHGCPADDDQPSGSPDRSTRPGDRATVGCEK